MNKQVLPYVIGGAVFAGSAYLVYQELQKYQDKNELLTKEITSLKAEVSNLKQVVAYLQQEYSKQRKYIEGQILQEQEEYTDEDEDEELESIESETDLDENEEELEELEHQILSALEQHDGEHNVTIEDITVDSDEDGYSEDESEHSTNSENSENSEDAEFTEDEDVVVVEDVTNDTVEAVVEDVTVDVVESVSVVSDDSSTTGETSPDRLSDDKKRELFSQLKASTEGDSVNSANSDSDDSGASVKGTNGGQCYFKFKNGKNCSHDSYKKGLCGKHYKNRHRIEKDQAR